MSEHPSAERPDPDVVVVDTGQRLRAVANTTRQRIIRVLRDRPATAAQLAALLGVTKGNAHYHLRILADAGLVAPVETRRVRGVTEIYYGRVGQGIVATPGEPGDPDWMMRTALAEVESAPDRGLTDMGLRIVRLSPADFEAATVMLREVYDRIRAMHDPDQPPADFFYALYRPRDYTRGTAEPDPAPPVPPPPAPPPPRP